MNSKVFTPFEIYGSLDTPFGDVGPDMQYFTDMNYVENMQCNYYLNRKCQDYVYMKWEYLSTV